MPRSRSSSQASLRSLQSNSSNRSINFRTVIRDRSNHKIVNPPKRNQPQKNDAPTLDQLEQMLKLSRSSKRSREIPQQSALSQRKFYPPQQSPLSQRKLLISQHSWKDTQRDVTTQRQKESFLKHQEEIIERKQNKIASRLSKSSSQSPNKGVFSRLMNNNQDLDLETIDKRLNDLVTKKLQLIKEHLSGKQNQNRPLFAMKSVSIDAELKDLLTKLTKIKVNGDNINQMGEQDILNKKIQCIQTLLAEKTIESQLMKKYVHGMHANKNKKKSLKTETYRNKITEACDSFSNFEKSQFQSKQQRERSPKKLKSLDNSTTNKNSFKTPNPEAYDIYKHSQKRPELNLQPLPRSSYKRDYLILKSEPIDQYLSQGNSETLFPKYLNDFSSNYTKDFKQFKTQIINHKQLDAYHDKLKFLKINYIPRKKTQLTTSMHERKKPLCDDIAITQSLPRTIKNLKRSSQTQSHFSKQMMVSEARRQFIWGAQIDKSRIKHKNLKELQYRLKNLYKS